MVSSVRTGIFILLASIAVLAMHPAAATTQALVERQTVGINDSFQLVLSTDQSLADAPDLSGLEQDFEVLGSAKSSNVSIVNGSMTRSAIWTLELMPRREGKLVIPAIVMGKESTAAVEITVVATTAGMKSAPDGEVDLEIDVDNLSPYVQQQFIFTIRVVHKIQFSSASLNEPKVSGGNVLVEKLGDDVAYETTRGGTRVGIVERRYAMFAQSSGKIVIDPLRFEGRIPDRRSFGVDPFGRGRVVRRRSELVEVDVRPIPAAFTGTTWLPAQQLMLVENSPGSAAEYRVGEPFTRTLTLQATGLSASQLPATEVPVPAGVKAYPDQPVLEDRMGEQGLVAMRQEKIALIPAQPGKLTLPAIEIPWWNTQTGQQEYARLPARSIDVLPGVSSPAGSVPGDSGSAAPTATEAIAAAAPEGAAIELGGTDIWRWISLALALGWLATALVWGWSRRPGRAEPVQQPNYKTAQGNTSQLLAAIKTASEQQDAAACKEALLEWANLQWPGSRIRSLGALAALLEGESQTQVHELSQCLYSHQGSGWDGKKFWQVFAARQTSPARDSHPAEPQLEPLYR